MTRKNLSAILAALIAATLFGASAPLSKILLGKIEPIPLAALLYLGSGLSAALFHALLRPANGERKESGLSRRDLPWLAGSILAGGVAGPILLLLGLQHTPAATAALLLNFETVSTTLIAALVFHEGIGRRAGWAVALVTLASILLSWDSSGSWGFSMGALAVLGACLLWGADNNFTRNISSKDPLMIVACKGLGAGLFSTALALGLGQPFPGWGGILPALLLGVLSYGVSITLFILAMRSLGAARSSALFCSAPFVGALIAFALLREPLQAAFLPAAALMGLGAWLLMSEQHTHAHVHKATLHDHRHAHDEGHHLHAHPPGVCPGGQSHAHSHEHEPQAHEHTHMPDTEHWHEHPGE